MADRNPNPKRKSKRETAGSRTPPPVEGYKSTSDLPMFKAWREQLTFLRIGAILKPSLRPEIRELEKTMNKMTASVDLFHTLMTGRNWVFSERWNMTELDGVMSTGDPDSVEEWILAYYADEGNLERVIAPLSVQPAMLARMPLIRRARLDQLEKRYYSVVLTLLAAMDGYVNDVGELKIGMHARSPEDLVGWDHVVALNGGLFTAHKSYTRTFKKTSSEPIYELHRNGIMHGILTNFDNPVVAAKAWNRISVVVDWAKSLEAAEEPAKVQPTLSEAMAALNESQAVARAYKAWNQRSATDPAAIAEEPVGIAANAFLDAWANRRWGLIGPLLKEWGKPQNGGVFASQLAERFGPWHLESFEVVTVEMLSATTAETTTAVTVNGVTERTKQRWFSEDDKGKTVPEFRSGGNWRTNYNFPEEWCASAKPLPNDSPNHDSK